MMAEDSRESDFLESLFGVGVDPLDPREASRRSARRALPKRFWREVAVVERGEGFAVALDGKIARTPSRHELAVPNRVLAEALAGEWRDLDTEINPSRMPLTRLVNTAIDAVAAHAEAVAADIVKYAESDLICYREALNERLAARQAAHWDQPLAYMREAYGARFTLAAGVIFTPQPEAAIAAVAVAVSQLPAPFGLAALHSVTTLTGSAILALALAAGRLSPDAAWAAAHVDEDFQIAAWGEDAEAQERRAARRVEFDAAAFLLSTLR
ncbi:Chaperone required for the assembly of the F1-ATPase [Rhizobiales bacterium GAS113]|nr:Chaperone required for the assembly of the F1-ATPase [Rhizobiales bacterium GAS113]